MLTSLLTSVIALGLVGGLHCALMCGPLIGVCASAEASRSGGALRYLSGRFVGHVLAGAVMGQVGAHASHLSSRSVVQLGLLLSIAALMLVRGLRLVFAAQTAPSDLVALRRGPSRSRAPRVQAFVASLLPRRALPLGLATSVLPCGLLAAGWGLAAAAAHPVHGALVMAAFSVATAPGLVAALLVGLRVAHLARRLSPRWQGALWCALALFLGARPLIDHVHGCCH